MNTLFLVQLNFLEAIGALTLVFGAFYLWLSNVDKKEKEIKFYRWILENDIIARDEFLEKYQHLKFGSSEYEYNKCLREFFTDEKLAEVNRRIKNKEGIPK
jgi:hypothetical protein